MRLISSGPARRVRVRPHDQFEAMLAFENVSDHDPPRLSIAVRTSREVSPKRARTFAIDCKSQLGLTG